MGAAASCATPGDMALRDEQLWSAAYIDAMPDRVDPGLSETERATTGFSDEDTVRALRSAQRKLRHIVAPRT